MTTIQTFTYFSLLVTDLLCLDGTLDPKANTAFYLSFPTHLLAYTLITYVLQNYNVWRNFIMKKSIYSLCIALTFTLTFILTSFSTAFNPRIEQTALSMAQNLVTSLNESNSDEKIIIENQLLLSKNNLTITAVGYMTNSAPKDGIKLLFENNSDSPILVKCDALIINDFMIDEVFSCVIAAGKKSNEILYISEAELSAADIPQIENIEIYFSAYNTKSNEIIFKSEHTSITNPEYKNEMMCIKNKNNIIYSDQMIEISVYDTINNGTDMQSIVLLIENKSNQNIVIASENMSVNGFMVSSLVYSTIYGNKQAVETLTLFSDELKNNNINCIESFEQTFKIIDAETHTLISETEPVLYEVIKE